MTAPGGTLRGAWFFAEAAVLTAPVLTAAALAVAGAALAGRLILPGHGFTPAQRRTVAVPCRGIGRPSVRAGVAS